MQKILDSRWDVETENKTLRRKAAAVKRISKLIHYEVDQTLDTPVIYGQQFHLDAVRKALEGK